MAITLEDKESGKDKIKHLFNNGLKLSYARFRDAVRNASGSPESQFDKASDKKGRRADLSLTAHALICRQDGVYFGTPTSNVVDFKFDVVTKE